MFLMSWREYIFCTSNKLRKYQFSRVIAKMGDPKKQAFWLRINILDELQFVKKYQNRTFKVNFRCQKSIEFFQKKISKNINLGDRFLVKTYFFLNSIFESLYFLKLRPIFEELTFLIGFFFQCSLVVCWCLAKNVTF
jgi:hypothetical protein